MLFAASMGVHLGGGQHGVADGVRLQKGVVRVTAVDNGLAPASVDDQDLVESAALSESPRGGFKIFTAPELQRPPAPEELTDEDVRGALEYFECADLVDDDHDEDDVRSAVGEMIRAISPGNIVNFLFDQGGENGMSLVHAWFGPNFPLFRHSHPRFGDCLYYIVAGSAILGSQVLNPGDGFFVPNGMAYKYRGGPDGVEVLEFRAGGGVEGAAAIRLQEASVDSIRRITASATELRSQWANPPRRIGGSAQSSASTPES
jgi:hypothetical protein